ncbi:MAG: PQQ-binding-like beta-propeller repeat protein [Alphaproteobacteria bacterium]|nr:PQQ-binding-like beta-propeller repeat protein [Alphaproteobacteria bacterium]
MSDASPQNLKILSDIIAETAITYASETQKIMSPTGQKQDWLIDLRPVLLNAKALDIITDLFWDQFQDQLPFQIGGMEVAAVPLVTALLMKAAQRGLNVSGFVIRKERKSSGLGKIIEGNLTDDPILLVDDIFNSGGSLEKARVVLEQEGKKLNQVFVVINFQAKSGNHWIQKNEVKLDHLLTLEPFKLEMASTDWEPPQMNYEVSWRFLEKGAFPFHVVPKSTPLVVDDRIYMGTEAGLMVCVDRHTGKALWKYDVKTHHPKGIWSSPAHYKDRIYFGAYNGIAYCLDAKTGKEIWKNPCCEFIGSSPLIVPETNMMYVGLEHQRPRQMGSNAAFDLDTGERKWEQAQKNYQHGSAAYYKPKNLVVFGNADHDISAYDAITGKLIWKHETQRSIKYPPAIDESLKLVVATSFDGNIYILDVETGSLKAAIPTQDICYTTPLITQGKIFAGSGDRHLYVIDAQNFELIKKMDCYARVYSSPKLIDGHIVFGTGGGNIIELHPETLKVEGMALLPDAITNAISVSPENDILYVSTIMNELYAIKRSKAG